MGKPATYAVENQFCFNGHAAAGARISREIGERLKMPRVMTDRLCYIVKDHMRFMNIKKMRESTLKRFLREEYFLELLELHRASCLASQKSLATHDFCIKMLARMPKKDLHPARILDGNDLVAMGFEQGPPLGEILFALESEQLEGRVRTRGEAKAFVNKRFSALRTR